MQRVSFTIYSELGADHKPIDPEKEEKETVVNSGLTFMQ